MIKQTYILVDGLNLLHRVKHVIRSDDPEEKIAMAYHMLFQSVYKAWREFKGSHVVFCFDGRSWRKSVDPTYKANRAVARAALTAAQVAEDTMFYEAFDNFQGWLATKANVTVLHHENCEADDFVARWIQRHPDADHVIVSSDSDFYQLLATNVRQYNGVSQQTITLDGFMDEKGKPVIDKKTKLPKAPPDPEWILFEKCIRGDSSDNIMSAFPGVRTKGSSKKVGIMEAFLDRHQKGYNYNSMMLQRWVDHEGVEHRVRDRFEANRALIDLTRQPEHIIAAMDDVINVERIKDGKKQIGAEFLRFCGKWDLQEIAKHPDNHVSYLNARYV